MKAPRSRRRRMLSRDIIGRGAPAGGQEAVQVPQPAYIRLSGSDIQRPPHHAGRGEPGRQHLESRERAADRSGVRWPGHRTRCLLNPPGSFSGSQESTCCAQPCHAARLVGASNMSIVSVPAGGERLDLNCRGSPAPAPTRTPAPAPTVSVVVEGLIRVLFTRGCVFDHDRIHLLGCRISAGSLDGAARFQRLPRSVDPSPDSQSSDLN